jgi:hypothetical protein
LKIAHIAWKKVCLRSDEFEGFKKKAPLVIEVHFGGLAGEGKRELRQIHASRLWITGVPPEIRRRDFVIQKHKGKKVNFALEQAIKAQRGSGGIAEPFL